MTGTWILIQTLVALIAFAAGVIAGGMRRRRLVDRQWDQARASAPWQVRTTSDATYEYSGSTSAPPGAGIRVLVARTGVHPDIGWVVLEQVVIGGVLGAHPQFETELNLLVGQAKHRATILNELLPLLPH